MRGHPSRAHDNLRARDDAGFNLELPIIQKDKFAKVLA